MVSVILTTGVTTADFIHDTMVVTTAILSVMVVMVDIMATDDSDMDISNKQYPSTYYSCRIKYQRFYLNCIASSYLILS